jgi:hypothetical protein
MSAASTRSTGRQEIPASYHVELRQFPHNFCHFNLSEHELYDTIVGPWAREQWIELGERKWSPHQAKLTVLEGPHLPIDQLSMGRGWRNAQRAGRDVTEQVLATARAANESSLQTGPAGSVGLTLPTQGVPTAADEGLLADSLGLELLTQLAGGELSLQRAWGLASARHPQRSAGQCLVLAERAVMALLTSGLVVLLRTDRAGETPRPIEQAEIKDILRALDSWTAGIVSIARR